MIKLNANDNFQNILWTDVKIMFHKDQLITKYRTRQILKNEKKKVKLRGFCMPRQARNYFTSKSSSLNRPNSQHEHPLLKNSKQLCFSEAADDQQPYCEYKKMKDMTFLNLLP